MYIQQADLFHGMDKEFVKEIMDVTVKKTYETGDFLFHEGDSADYFFILLKGKVALTSGVVGQVIHVVNHSGEAFGWSSLVGRGTYSASAMCEMPTKLLRATAATVREILEKHPDHGLLFYRRLATSLGTRLIQTYQTLTSSSQVGMAPSAGARNLVEAEVI